jgi:hypothetical protein
LGCQGLISAHGRLIGKEPITIVGPVQYQRRQLCHKGPLLFRLHLRVTMLQAPHANPQRMQHLPQQTVGEVRRWRAMAEGCRAPLAGPRHPLTDGSLADAEGLGNQALRPALVLELTGLQPPGFFPSRG